MFHLAKIRFIPHLLNPQENKLSRNSKAVPIPSSGTGHGFVYISL